MSILSISSGEFERFLRGSHDTLLARHVLVLEAGERHHDVGRGDALHRGEQREQAVFGEAGPDDDDSESDEEGAKEEAPLRSRPNGADHRPRLVHALGYEIEIELEPLAFDSRTMRRSRPAAKPTAKR